MNLKTKRILITGAAKRAGKIIAGVLAAAGCRVVLHCHQSLREAEELLKSLPGEGHELLCADLASPAERRKFLRELPPLELLVNNAALFLRPGSPEDSEAAELYRQVNYLAPLELLEHFAAQGGVGEAAVNLLDASVFRRPVTEYEKSKRELAEATLRLAAQWSAGKMRLNAVAPGPMLPAPWAADTGMRRIRQVIPNGEIIPPASIAAAVKFLLETDGLTGVILPVDGGMHLRESGGTTLP